MSKGGKDWGNFFGYMNSGTYNNQYQIVDYKKFVPYQRTLQNELLYIVEQIPGYILIIIVILNDKLL
jgi:hypothetical protein